MENQEGKKPPGELQVYSDYDAGQQEYTSIFIDRPKGLAAKALIHRGESRLEVVTNRQFDVINLPVSNGVYRQYLYSMQELDELSKLVEDYKKNSARRILGGVTGHYDHLRIINAIVELLNVKNRTINHK